MSPSAPTAYHAAPPLSSTEYHLQQAGIATAAMPPRHEPRYAAFICHADAILVAIIIYRHFRPHATPY
jgi:hypothetical protein